MRGFAVEHFTVASGAEAFNPDLPVVTTLTQAFKQVDAPALLFLIQYHIYQPCR